MCVSFLTTYFNPYTTSLSHLKISQRSFLGKIGKFSSAGWGGGETNKPMPDQTLAYSEGEQQVSRRIVRAGRHKGNRRAHFRLSGVPTPGGFAGVAGIRPAFPGASSPGQSSI